MELSLTPLSRRFVGLFIGLLLTLTSIVVGGGPVAVAAEASSAHDPDLKLGSACRGRPGAKALVAALPSYIKELVVQWPRAGTRKGAVGCVSVARLTLVDHQGLITTLSVEVYGAAQPVPEPDYRVIDTDGMPRAVLTQRPSSEFPQILISLSGPPAAARDSLERSLEFVPMDTLVGEFGALLRGR